MVARPEQILEQGYVEQVHAAAGVHVRIGLGDGCGRPNEEQHREIA